MLDQVCLDVPASSLEDEVAFWAATLDADASPSVRRPEFTNLRRPDHLPLRLLFQEVGHAGEVTAHPDLATTDRPAEVARLVGLGAAVVEVEEFWTVLEAPDGRLLLRDRAGPEHRPAQLARRLHGRLQRGGGAAHHVGIELEHLAVPGEQPVELVLDVAQLGVDGGGEALAR